MPRVMVLHHSDGVGAGFLAEAAADAGIELQHLRLHRDARLPAAAECDGIVSLGGFMGAYEDEAYPFLAAEKELLRRAVGRNVPVLGICLGCQILAEALGGAAFPAPKLEGGLLPIELTEEGRADPVLSPVRGPQIVLHGDTWSLPPKAEVLASSKIHPHAFRLGSAVGIQFHPEAHAGLVRGWLEELGSAKLHAAGVDGNAFLQAVRHNEPELRAQALKMFGGWLAGVS